MFDTHYGAFKDFNEESTLHSSNLKDSMESKFSIDERENTGGVGKEKDQVLITYNSSNNCPSIANQYKNCTIASNTNEKVSTTSESLNNLNKDEIDDSWEIVPSKSHCCNDEEYSCKKFDDVNFLENWM